jgi:hypothetical protein
MRKKNHDMHGAPPMPKQTANISMPTESESPYISPRELVTRWQCARSSVDRITRRAGLTRVCLGEGVNGMIRYFRREVEAYEQSRQIGATV